MLGGHQARVPNSHRSLRDGSYPAIFQAINCLATFIQSLRDKSTPRFSLLMFPNPICVNPCSSAVVFLFRPAAAGRLLDDGGRSGEGGTAKEEYDCSGAPARIGRYGPSGRWEFARRLAVLRRGARNQRSSPPHLSVPPR